VHPQPEGHVVADTYVQKQQRRLKHHRKLAARPRRVIGTERQGQGTPEKQQGCW